MDRPLTAAELAALVRIMRRDQEHWHHCMTQAAAMKVNYSERQVDRAVLRIMADEPPPVPQPETDEEAAAVAVYFANQL